MEVTPIPFADVRMPSGSIQERNMRLGSVLWIGTVLAALLTQQMASAMFSSGPGFPNPFDRPAKVQPYTIDDETEIILDGIKVEWSDVPAQGTEVIELKLWQRHIDRIELKTKGR